MTALTLEALAHALRRRGVDASRDFWSAMLHHFSISKVAFSRHLPDDQFMYVLAAVPEWGSPATLLMPERWKQDLPPLPSILDLANPVTDLGLDGVSAADGGLRRLSNPRFGVDPGPVA